MSHMKILELARAFDYDSGQGELIGVHVVFGEEDGFEERFHKTLTFAELQVTLEEAVQLMKQDWCERLQTFDLQQVKPNAGLLRCADLYPDFDPDKYTEYKEHPDSPTDLVFLKKRSLLVLDPDLLESVQSTKKFILAELRACELLRKFPHPNIAKYLGCRVQANRVTAIYYERISKDLQIDATVPLPVDKYINDIRKGIEHLHSLGFCHNDISPFNIMLRDDDTAVIIDFDACLPTGEKMIKEAGMEFSRDAELSETENDWFGLKQLEIWMHEWNKLHSTENTQNSTGNQA